jgi:uncharacterized protein (TIGR02757 family)
LLSRQSLYELLESKAAEFNRPTFIENDPICIPHAYEKQQDIEISGLIAAVLAWGQRKTIIRKCQEFFALMDHAPYDFILHHQEQDLKSFLDFRHRTFNATDALYFIAFLHHYYQQHDSLEDAFAQAIQADDMDVEKGLTYFHQLFFSLPDFPSRTRKHIATPARNSACKRLNMYLRWMVRKDDQGVDFGLWHKIKPSQLICPCDLHVDRVARQLGLISRKQTDWLTATELTQNLRLFDPHDPVRYDFALFGLGIEERMK